MIALGDLLGLGDVRPVDGAGALAAYEKAVSLGEPHALLRIGDLYYYDPGNAVGIDQGKGV